MSAYSARKRRRRSSKAGPARLIIILVVFVLLAGAAGVAVAVGYVLNVARDVNLSDIKPRTAGAVSVVYASDGKTRLGFIQGDVLRTVIPRKQMPSTIRNATVAIEDQRFYKHKGVDYQGVIRAAVNNVLNHKDVQGGSTLTMQLIRNIYTHDAKRTFKRKIQEARLAQQLEEEHPGRAGKQFILTQYLNNAPYGTTLNGKQAIGVQAAARVYFDKQARELTLPESALLAGLPQAPSLYDPLRYPKAALTRRNEVLKAMKQQKMITSSQYLSAVLTPLGLKANDYFAKRREGFVLDYVSRELRKHYGAKIFNKGGMKVYTSINLKWQRVARNAIAHELSVPGDPSAALVSINPKNGHILAMASSGKYSLSNLFNLATDGHRQPGSTFKVITLMAAIARGADPKQTYYDSHPLNFFDAATGTKIDVHTDDNKYTGSTSLFEGLVHSDNTIYQQLDLDVGPENVTRTAHLMGITSHLDSFPAEGLGGLKNGVTPLEMANAYATIASGGYRNHPVAITKVVFANGRTDTKIGHPKRNKVFTDGETDAAIQPMHANIERGTGTGANIGCDSQAGKTGTTSNFTDAWFDGMVPGLVTAVWVGYPKSTISMTNVPNWGTMFGGLAPAAIWHDFMAKVAPCRPWPAIRDPFVGRQFTGRYSTSANSDPCATDPTQCTTTTPTPATTTAPPPIFAKPPASTGTGGGVGTGTGAGGGAAGTGGASPTG